ncbi:hypothetical protein [Nocardia abscessus]|uniref:hypothetical protein n=1 Tax=Nocardia abscessus TaxID=120957 RepID=UPI0024561911|nr:hypothetical protein [Nocardia abscessus]
MPEQKILFASDLVKARAGLYIGVAFHRGWATTTLDRIQNYGAEILIGGRDAVYRDRAEVDAPIGQTRKFL